MIADTRAALAVGNWLVAAVVGAAIVFTYAFAYLSLSVGSSLPAVPMTMLHVLILLALSTAALVLLVGGDPRIWRNRLLYERLVDEAPEAHEADPTERARTVLALQLRARRSGLFMLAWQVGIAVGTGLSLPQLASAQPVALWLVICGSGAAAFAAYLLIANDDRWLVAQYERYSTASTTPA